MCGIVGVIAKYKNGFTAPEADMFRDMLFVDTMRGWDSTGVFGANRHNNVLIHKEASHGADFICTKEFKDFHSKMIRDGSFAVGHNRSATRGTVKDENAHPFWVDDKIVLVQNGTYRGSHNHLKNTEVDTEALAHVISEEPDVAKALQRINAAYALVWYNVDNQTLHIIRNNERPLYVASSADGTIMFASEYATIAWAAHRNNIAFNEKPELVPVNKLLTYKILPDGDHEYVAADIDCHYKSPVYKGEPFRPQGEHAHGTWPDDVYGYGVEMGRHYGGYGYQPPVDRKNDMSVVMSQYAIEKLPEFHMTVSDTKEFEARLKKKVYENAQRTVNVELLDYVKGNKHDECSCFIIYGKMVDPILDDGPQPLFHWLVYDTTELEVYNKIAANPFYVAEIASIIPHYFLPNDSNQRKGVITCFITGTVPCDNVEMKAMANVH